MRKNFITLGLLGILACSSIGMAAFSNSKSNYSEAFCYYTNHDGDTYYSSISDSLEGDDLLRALRSLNATKRKNTVGYSGMGTSPSGQFKYTDYDPNSVKYDSNGQPYGTKLLTFYSSNSATSGMNREHVWPKSHGGNLVENDIHMPRPTLNAENGSRGNSFYVEGKCNQSSGWDPAMEDFGIESYRGDSARIIFYCVVASSSLSLIEADSHPTSNKNRDNLMGRLSHMLKWNLKYPVQQREQNRNEGAEYLQGNRNPFIDHPEYACRIWGNTNAETKSVCSGYYHEKTLVSITIDNPKTEYQINEKFVKPDVIAHYDDGSTQNVKESASFSGFGSTTLGQKTITVTYEGKTTSYTINVIEALPPAVTKLEVTNPVKSHYYIGEEFVTPIVQATYEDGSVVDVSNKATYTGFDSSEPANKQTITVTFEGVTTTYDVLITKRPSEDNPPQNNNGCGGNVVTTSVIITSLSFIGVAFITISYLVRKKKREE